MSNAKKKAATVVDTAPAGPWEKAVREAVDLLGWRVRYLPSIETEGGWIKVTDPIHDMDIIVNIRRGEACDDSLWEVLARHSSLLHAQVQRSEDFPG